MSRGEYGRPRTQLAGHATSYAVGFSPFPAGFVPQLPSVDDIRQKLEHGAEQLHQAVEQQVEHTVKVRGAILLAGAVGALGLIIAFSVMADP